MRVSLFLLLAFQFVSCSKQKHFEKITYEGNIYESKKHCFLIFRFSQIAILNSNKN